jgi:hypothetical protein
MKICFRFSSTTMVCPISKNIPTYSLPLVEKMTTRNLVHGSEALAFALRYFPRMRFVFMKKELHSNCI